MKIVGVNKGKTHFGKELREGASCILQDGSILAALPEERVTRRKREGGFVNSLDVLSRSLKCTADDFDLIVVSTCCENESAALEGHELSASKQLVSVNHHLSHAYHAFYCSGFDSAIIAVIDGGGNTFETPSNGEWWAVSREQHSYFFAENGLVELVDRDFAAPFEAGFGELYRAVTYYLGWNSSQHCGKTMALAAHGSSYRIKGEPCFQLDQGGQLRSPVRNSPREPIRMILELAKSMDLDIGEPRTPQGEILPIHKNLASYLQHSVEVSLLAKLKFLKSKYKTENLCVSGGVALNCLLNAKIIKEGLFRRVYVPSAPGDSGQAAGNAIYGYQKLLSKERRGMNLRTFASADAFLGPKLEVNSRAVSNALRAVNRPEYIVFETNRLHELVAKLLNKGMLVAVCQGKSEYGPRALGNRSILGDPRSSELALEAATAKSREWWQPFAPSVLAEHADQLFVQQAPSPYMSFAWDVREAGKGNLCGVISKDGLSRVQTVDPSQRTFLRSVLESFYDITGVPCVLNTSFNRKGEPIVESLKDAVESFALMPINSLAIGRFLILKVLTPEIHDCDIMTRNYNISLELRSGESTMRFNSPGDGKLAIRWLQRNSARTVFVRESLPLYDEYLDWFLAGRKVTTIRFRSDAVELPVAETLPIIETSGYERPQTTTPSAQAKISKVTYKPYAELTHEDALRDGFTSLEELQAVIKGKIYKDIQDSDLVTIYSIAPAQGSYIEANYRNSPK